MARLLLDPPALRSALEEIQPRDIAAPYLSVAELVRLAPRRLLTDVTALMGSVSDTNALVVWARQSSCRLRHLRGLHAKLALGENGAYMGSANFTGNGLDRNAELGILLNDPEDVAALRGWFQEKWNEAESFTLEELEEYSAVTRDSPPRPVLPPFRPAPSQDAGESEVPPLPPGRAMVSIWKWSVFCADVQAGLDHPLKHFSTKPRLHKLEPGDRLYLFAYDEGEIFLVARLTVGAKHREEEEYVVQATPDGSKLYDFTGHDESELLAEILGKDPTIARDRLYQSLRSLSELSPEQEAPLWHLSETLPPLAPNAFDRDEDVELALAIGDRFFDRGQADGYLRLAGRLIAALGLKEGDRRLSVTLPRDETGPRINLMGRWALLPLPEESELWVKVLLPEGIVPNAERAEGAGAPTAAPPCRWWDLPAGDDPEELWADLPSLETACRATLEARRGGSALQKHHRPDALRLMTDAEYRKRILDLVFPDDDETV